MSNPFRDAGQPAGGLGARQPGQYDSAQPNHQGSTGAHDWNFNAQPGKGQPGQPAAQKPAGGFDQQNQAFDDLLGLGPSAPGNPAQPQPASAFQTSQQQPSPFDFGLPQPGQQPGAQPAQAPGQPGAPKQQSFDFFGDFGGNAPADQQAAAKLGAPVNQAALPGLGADKSAVDDGPDADDCELGSDMESDEEGNLGGAMAGMGQSQIKQADRPQAAAINFDFNAGNVEEEKKGDNGLGNLGADPMAAFFEADKGNGDPQAPAEQVQEQSAFEVQEVEAAQQQHPSQEALPADVQEAHEAFPDTDLELVKELYLQAGRNKQVLFNMLMQMAGIDIPEEELQVVRPPQESSGQRARQQQAAEEAAMLQALAGGGQEDAMTEQEIADMQMAAAMQQREINRAQQEQAQRRSVRQQQRADPRRRNQNQGGQQRGDRGYAEHIASRQQRNQGLVDDDDGQNFQDIGLGDDDQPDQWKFRKAQPEKGPAGKQGGGGGFLASLFGCMSSKKGDKNAGLEKKGERPARRPPQQQQRQDINFESDDSENGDAQQQQPAEARDGGRRQQRRPQNNNADGL